MKEMTEKEFSFICLDWELTKEIIMGYNHNTSTDSKTYTIVDFYYDTYDRALQQKKYVFRKRLSSKDKNIIYTIKGPTSVVNGVPERQEVEMENYDLIIKLLKTSFGRDLDLELVQQRATLRTEVKYDGYSMFIDKTMYLNGAEYFNIELECYKDENIPNMVGFAKYLDGKNNIYSTQFSKFQIGKVVEKLGIEDRIDSSNYMKILGYKE